MKFFETHWIHFSSANHTFVANHWINSVWFREILWALYLRLGINPCEFHVSFAIIFASISMVQHGTIHYHQFPKQKTSYPKTPKCDLQDELYTIVKYHQTNKPKLWEKTNQWNFDSHQKNGRSPIWGTLPGGWWRSQGIQIVCFSFSLSVLWCLK